MTKYFTTSTDGDADDKNKVCNDIDDGDLDDLDEDTDVDLDEAQMVYLVQPLAARAPHYTRSAFPGLPNSPLIIIIIIIMPMKRGTGTYGENIC